MYHYHHEPSNGDNRQFFNPFFSQMFFPNWNQPGPGAGPGQLPGFPGQPYGPEEPTTGFPGGQSASAPQTPPPPFTPTQSQLQTKAIDPGSIHGCLYRFTYIWLDRDSFWFYPIFVGRNSVSGFRWSRFRWVYFGIDLNRIQSFQCY